MKEENIKIIKIIIIKLSFERVVSSIIKIWVKYKRIFTAQMRAKLMNNYSIFKISKNILSLEGAFN